MIACSAYSAAIAASSSSLQRGRVRELAVAPPAETAVVVDRRHPLVPRGPAFSFRRPGSCGCRTPRRSACGSSRRRRRREPDEEVRHSTCWLRPLVHVRDGEAQVVVLHVGGDVWHRLQDLGDHLLPGVAAGPSSTTKLTWHRPRGRVDLGGEEVHVGRRADRVEAPQASAETGGRRPPARDDRAWRSARPPGARAQRAACPGRRVALPGRPRTR